MEGILYDISLFESPVAVIAGLALLAVAVGSILLGRMADEEKKGNSIFWAESPYTDVSEPAPAEPRSIPRAA